MMNRLNTLKIAIRLLLMMTFLTGILYPALVTVIAQFLFPASANGRLIKQNNQFIGSQWIGQSFTSERYFWGRPSATEPFPYNAMNSSGSNFSAMNPLFLAAVQHRIDILKKMDPKKQIAIPVDLVTASASGLDPEISPYAAIYQAPRIAKIRNIPEQEVLMLIQQLTIPRYLNILGEPRINVLQLNLALDHYKVTHA